MIEIPRRSVTRFFIPLIDVLTLLFCIYLLLPIVETPASSSASGDKTAGGAAAELLDKNEREELQRLRQESRLLRKTSRLADDERFALERIRTEKVEILQQRLAIRVLEIDADTGRLFYNGRDRVEIKSEADARELVERQKREAPSREIYFLFLIPRTPSPLLRQMEQYKRWFQDVAYGIDNPYSEQ